MTCGRFVAGLYVKHSQWLTPCTSKRKRLNFFAFLGTTLHSTNLKKTQQQWKIQFFHRPGSARQQEAKKTSLGCQKGKDLEPQKARNRITLTRIWPKNVSIKLSLVSFTSLLRLSQSNPCPSQSLSLLHLSISVLSLSMSLMHLSISVLSFSMSLCLSIAVPFLFSFCCYLSHTLCLSFSLRLFSRSFIHRISFSFSLSISLSRPFSLSFASYSFLNCFLSFLFFGFLSSFFISFLPALPSLSVPFSLFLLLFFPPSLQPSVHLFPVFRISWNAMRISKYYFTCHGLETCFK